MNTVSAYGQCTSICGARETSRVEMSVGFSPTEHASVANRRLTAVKAGGARPCHPRAMATATLTADLLRRYDRAGPRYTSYPTAPHFSTAFDERALSRGRARDQRRPDSAAAVAVRARAVLLEPVLLLRLQPHHHARQVARGTLPRLAVPRDRPGGRHVRPRPRGGAAPLRRRHAQLPLARRAARGRRDAAPPLPLRESDERDFSIELDPRTIDAADVRELAAIGFNRASLGVQDFDPAVQAAVNRIQTVEQTVEVIDACRRHGFRSVNVDLIYGLPKQTLDGFGTTLDTVVAARPDRLAIYGYAHLPRLFIAQRQIATASLPPPERKLELLQLAIDRLTAAGYVLHRHGSLRAAGRRACDRARGGHPASQFHGLHDARRQRSRRLRRQRDQPRRRPTARMRATSPAWQAAIDDGRLPICRGMRMSGDDVVRADVIQQLMCHGEVLVARDRAPPRHRLRRVFPRRAGGAAAAGGRTGSCASDTTGSP